MRNPQETDLKNTSDKETKLDFSLPEESRWLAFWENLKGLFVKAVASSVSATPAETDLLLASAVWYSTIFGNFKSVLIGQPQPAVTARPVENSLLLKSRRRSGLCGKTLQPCSERRKQLQAQPQFKLTYFWK